MDQSTLTRDQITEILPHRNSMLLVDEVTELAPGRYAVGRYWVDPALDVLKGHFAGDPILPGVYTLEISVQITHLLILSSPEFAARSPAFLGVNGSRCYQRVRPGDQLEIRTEIIPEKTTDELLTVSAKVSGAGGPVAGIEIVFSLQGLLPAAEMVDPPIPGRVLGHGEPIAMSNSDILHHTRIRDPYRLLDEIPELVPGRYAVGRFYADPNMPVFRNYRPQDPLLPASYLIEATEQVGGISVACSPEFSGKRSLLLGINHARIYRNVRPGETVETYSYITHVRKDKFIVTYANKACVAGELAAETEIAIAMR